MVTGFLCGAITMNNKWNDEICTIHPTAIAFGYFAAKKLSFFGTSWLYNIFWRKFARSSYHDFWNIWSWGFCVVPLWWMTCEMIKNVQFVQQRMHLDILLQRNLVFWDICGYFWKKLARASHPDFWNKWSWGLCVVPLRRMSCERMKSVQFPTQRMHLVTLPQRN